MKPKTVKRVFASSRNRGRGRYHNPYTPYYTPSASAYVCDSCGLEGEKGECFIIIYIYLIYSIVIYTQEKYSFLYSPSPPTPPLTPVTPKRKRRDSNGQDVGCWGMGDGLVRGGELG